MLKDNSKMKTRSNKRKYAATISAPVSPSMPFHINDDNEIMPGVNPMNGIFYTPVPKNLPVLDTFGSPSTMLEVPATKSVPITPLKPIKKDLEKEFASVFSSTQEDDDFIQMFADPGPPDDTESPLPSPPPLPLPKKRSYDNDLNYGLLVRERKTIDHLLVADMIKENIGGYVPYTNVNSEIYKTVNKYLESISEYRPITMAVKYSHYFLFVNISLKDNGQLIAIMEFPCPAAPKIMYKLNKVVKCM